MCKKDYSGSARRGGLEKRDGCRWGRQENIVRLLKFRVMIMKDGTWVAVGQIKLKGMESRDVTR